MIAPGRVVRVQGGEDEMASERRLDGDLRRLEIAGLANHDAVRVLSENARKDARKSKANSFVNRHLNDAFEIVLNRFFRRQQFGIDRVDLPKTRIKRRGLPGTSRPGNNKDSVRSLDYFEKKSWITSGMPSISRSRFTVLRSSTRSTTLSPNWSESRDTKIDIAPGNIFLNTTVLRQSAFGDIHICHHFHARNNRQSEMSRRRRHFVECPVDTIADFEFVFERLEMNVAGPVLDRLVENQIDETDDRGGVCFGFYPPVARRLGTALARRLRRVV